ncbi:hypothetical protein [Deinococcus sp.]|uniref:hypothetical protein n=1 Tax=Deinococcus sp. TaxID=47478 RepID=UPI0025D81281|nr:hypothetical protein [Deinococcus sp.]
MPRRSLPVRALRRLRQLPRLPAYDVMLLVLTVALAAALLVIIVRYARTGELSTAAAGMLTTMVTGLYTLLKARSGQKDEPGTREDKPDAPKPD